MIFGKDRATGLGAESPAEAAFQVENENVNTEEVGIEDVNISADDGDNDAYVPFSDPSIGSQRRPDLNSESNVTRNRNRKKRAGDSNIDQFRGALIKNLERANEQVGRLADCFQFMADDAARRLKVMDLIAEHKDDVEGLTEEDIVEITELILSNSTRVDVFFSSNNERRKIYVKKYFRQVRQL